MRRQRFTAYLQEADTGADIEPRVCLGYSVDGVREHYEQRYIVVSIERGDHRVKARHAAIKGRDSASPSLEPCR